MSKSARIKVQKNKEIIFENLKAIKSETKEDSIIYEIDFKFENNPTYLQIHIEYNFLVFDCMFDVEDEDQYNWYKNDGNNEFGIIRFTEESKTERGKLYEVNFLKNTREKNFVNSEPNDIRVKQIKKINNVTTTTTIFKENILMNEYQFLVEIEEYLINIRFNKEYIIILSDKNNIYYDVRELPIVSTGYVYRIR